MNYQNLYKVREPLCKDSHKGAFIVHFFSTKEKAESFAKGKGVLGNNAEVSGPKSYRVENGYVVCGKIDK